MSGMIERQDRRYLRAQVLVHETLRRLEPFIEYEAHRQVHDALCELFMDKGVEVLTDYNRAEIGLPPRDRRGWTAEEIVAFERFRLEQMINPMRTFIAAKEDVVRFDGRE